jgi:hypothetical protein
VKGGQTITVQAPIDTIPLFVRAGSIFRWERRWRARMRAGHCEGSRLSRRGCELHALLRRRHDLCLRKGRVIDTIVTQAREHHVRLDLLWFGTWKNGSQHYMPEWMKPTRSAIST